MLLLLATAVLTVCSWRLASAEAALDNLTIMVPAEPGGGWDLTAKAMADALRSAHLVESVEIEYSPGAGGVIGLAQFVSSHQGRGDALFVGGMFTVGSVIQNHAAVSLLDTTPVARLTYDNAVIAVPAGSSFKSADDLIETMLSAPQSITWVGGSRAGVDEINLYEIARGLGVSTSRLNYTGLPGGGEVGAALAEGRYSAGISGYSEFEDLVRDGRLRVLAVLNASDLAGVDAPSFRKLGIAVQRLNWRGVFAPPGIDDEQLRVLATVTERMVHSPEWQRLLVGNHWLDAYLPGQAFIDFVASEQGRVADDLQQMKEADPHDAVVIKNVLLRRYEWALGLAVVSILLLAAILFQRYYARRRELGLQQAYEQATGKVISHTEELERALTRIQNHIELEFDTWNLTSAEREIALLLLKGLRLKDIANARGTSERTVRQQAQAVYKKARLEGRFELAAYFIEDIIQSMEPDGEAAPAER